MRRLIERGIAAGVTFASFIALILSLRPKGHSYTGVQVALMTLAGVAFCVSVAFDIHDFRRSRPRSMKSERQIRDYMYNWIVRGGKVAIFSRSLGWVADREMRDMLSTKARDGDLTLVMPTAVEQSTALEADGAKAIYYGDTGYTIRSRFTIINRERADTAVAIGRTSNGVHLVTEYSSSDDDPSFWLAQDLIEILSRLDALGRQETRRPE